MQNFQNFQRNRIYSVKDSILIECNFDDRKAKIGSERISLSNSIPKYKKCEDIKMNSGWINFMKDLLKELKP